jgi:hypothetical protein
MSDEFYNLVGSEVKPTYHFYWDEGIKKVLLENPGHPGEDWEVVWNRQSRIALADDPDLRKIRTKIKDGEAIQVDHSQNLWVFPNWAITPRNSL